MNLQSLCQTVRYKGEFVWAVIQLGPSQVSALWNSEVSAFQGVCLYSVVCIKVYGDGITDWAKCLHYRRWLHFRGVCKAGFYCIRINTVEISPVFYLNRMFSSFLTNKMSLVFRYTQETVISLSHSPLTSMHYHYLCLKLKYYLLVFHPAYAHTLHTKTKDSWPWGAYHACTNTYM